MKTGIVKDWRYTEHNMGAFHVETPQRLEVIYRMIEEKITFPLQEIPPRSATEKELGLIHTQTYIDSIKSTAGKDRVHLDADTSTSARSYQTALLAAGGVLEAIDHIMEGKIANGFALVRPPGHHAESSKAMGFCLFNNIAVGAAYLLKKHALRKILVVDWDLHHGNGTQHSFAERSDALYFSTHQFPHYPGTGHWSEVGSGEGEGFTVNVPLTSAKSDADLLSIYDQVLRPITAEYQPEFILVSAGFDIYEDDPLGLMQISKKGFGALTYTVMDLAREFASHRVLLTLEGGYNLQGLQDGVENVLRQLSGTATKPSVKPLASPSTEKELAPVIDTQTKYWPSLGR